jgi:hypothetical protein
MTGTIISQVTDRAARAQVERIAVSEAVRQSETLQRLLRYLTEKSLSGEADHLKEYTIGMDIFDKGAEYDPRQDSGVRIHVGRLRLKLAEYYAGEGLHDPVVITLPKGRFKLLFEERLASVPEVITAEQPVETGLQVATPVATPWRTVAIVLAAALVLALVWGIWSSLTLRRVHQEQALDPIWTPAMQQFWNPLVDTNRPLLIVVATPLFVGLRGVGVYRDMNNNQWDDAANDPNLKAVRKAVGNPDIFPVRSYAGFGEAKSAVLLGTLLTRHARNIHFVRSIDLSWQQVSESNVVFLGGTKTFGETLASLPVKPEMTLDSTGLHILSAKDGKPAFFTDEMIGGSGSGLSSLPDDGVVNAVIGILPGPNGKGFVATFLSNLNTGILAAVEYATEPTLLRQLNEQLRDKSGRVPRYFQVALQVTFKGGVPISTRYSLHREVHLNPTAVNK